VLTRTAARIDACRFEQITAKELNFARMQTPSPQCHSTPPSADTMDVRAIDGDCVSNAYDFERSCFATHNMRAQLSRRRHGNFTT